MSKDINIAVVGLGQVGIYLLNELNTKKRYIQLKTGKKINVVAISANNINKKRRFKIDKKIFYKNPLQIFNKKKIDIIFEAVGSSDGISKKIVEVSNWSLDQRKKKGKLLKGFIEKNFAIKIIGDKYFEIYNSVKPKKKIFHLIFFIMLLIRLEITQL